MTYTIRKIVEGIENMTLASAALLYAGEGWPVLPCEPRSKRPCGHLVPRGVKDATIDLAVIREWWRREPFANIGLAMGSGFMVLDLDGEEGMASLRQLEAERGKLPFTRSVITGGGVHFYFFYDPDVKVVSRRIAPGIDVRGPGTYVIAPPSVHENGRVYTNV